VEEGTLFNSWSTGKGTASTVVHVLAERGLLDYGTPVAEYWPEFAVHGKGGVTLAHVLTHSAGVPQAPSGVTLATLADWDTIAPGSPRSNRSGSRAPRPGTTP